MLLWQNIDGIEIDRTYVSKSIEFADNKTSFYFTGSNAEQVITEDWQNVIHSASAAYVCENGGDILEIGFASSNYI